VSTDDFQNDSHTALLTTGLMYESSTILLLHIYALASYYRIAHHALLIRHNVHKYVLFVLAYSFYLYILVVVSCVSCIDYAYLQDGLTPLMLAAQFGSLSVAKLLVETYKCDVNEESTKMVSENYT